MKKLCFIVTAVVFTLMSGIAFAAPVEVPLIAGQYYEIGTVRVSDDGTDLTVEYIIDGACEGIELTETHLHVAEDPEDIPQTNKGNPKIGNFDYSGALSFTIPLSMFSSPPVTLYVAAHAVASNSELWEEISEITGVTVEILGYGATDPYLDIVISNDGYLDGPHTAWCLDLYDEIVVEEELNAEVFTGVVSPQINWLLNNWMDYIGDTSDQGDPYVPGDIQAAIWILVHGSLPAFQIPDPDPAPPAQDLNPWSKWAWGLWNWGDWSDEDTGLPPNTTGNRLAYDKEEYDDDVARAQEIVDDAMLYGAGYQPGCCDVVGLVLLPYQVGTQLIDLVEVDVRVYLQPLLIPVPAPCDETAWGDGIDGIPFAPINPKNGKRSGSWATYFEYELLED